MHHQLARVRPSAARSTPLEQRKLYECGVKWRKDHIRAVAQSAPLGSLLVCRDNSRHLRFTSLNIMRGFRSKTKLQVSAVHTQTIANATSQAPTLTASVLAIVNSISGLLFILRSIGCGTPRLFWWLVQKKESQGTSGPIGDWIGNIEEGGGCLRSSKC